MYHKEKIVLAEKSCYLLSCRKITLKSIKMLYIKIDFQILALS